MKWGSRTAGLNLQTHASHLIVSRSLSFTPLVAGFGMSHLDGLEGLVSVLQAEIDRVLEQEHALVKVLDDDGGGDGDGEVVGLQVDVLLAVSPQQGRSQQREPEGPRHISRQLTNSPKTDVNRNSLLSAVDFFF